MHDRPEPHTDLASWLDGRPEINAITAAVCDLNGQWRGKRITRAGFNKVLTDGLRMPLSALGVDVWGRDAPASGMVFETGDADGVARTTGRGPIPGGREDKGDAFLPMWLFRDDGTPFPADPRQALASVVDRFRVAGLAPVVATELEFYLVDPNGTAPTPPDVPGTGERLAYEGILSVDELDTVSGFLGDVYAACAAQGVPADTAISECGCGQFEVNLRHCDDLLRAGDDAVLFKRLVRQAARRHGLAATFMAKPYGDRSGSGLHVHMSMLDEGGRNVFDDGGEAGSDALRHAVAGLIAAMPETMLVFAPHLNSYRRFAPGTHAPTSAAWGYENRTSAIRIPGGPGSARRIEHRVSGADANPYLVLAAILGAALNGIEHGQAPPDPIEGNAYAYDLTPLPAEWSAAVDAFETGERAAGLFDPTLRAMFVAAKRQEMAEFAARVSPFEHRTYLHGI